MAGVASAAMDDRFVREDGLAGEIARRVEPVLADLGFRLVRVRVSGQDGATLQIMAERPDGTMTIEDCVDVSRQLSPVLDVHDPLPGRYRLEISSPGIDRPLVRASDFDAWKGHEARLDTRELIEGRKRFRGVLVGFEDGEVLLDVDLPGVGQQVIGLRLDLLAEAKLVLTDALVRETLRRSERAKIVEGSSEAQVEMETEARLVSRGAATTIGGPPARMDVAATGEATVSRPPVSRRSETGQSGKDGPAAVKPGRARHEKHHRQKGR